MKQPPASLHSDIHVHWHSGQDHDTFSFAVLYIDTHGVAASRANTTGRGDTADGQSMMDWRPWNASHEGNRRPRHAPLPFRFRPS